MKIKYKIIAAFIFLFLISTVTGLRISGPDYQGYEDYFLRGDEFESYLLNTKYYFGSNPYYSEILFFGIMALVKSLNLNFNIFLLVISWMEILLLLKVTSYQKNLLLFLIGYFLCLYITLNGWYIRQGLSTLFLLNSFYFFKYEKKFQGTIFLICAIFSHSSAIYLIALVVLIMALKKNIYILMALIASFAFNFIISKDGNLLVNSGLLLNYSEYINSDFSQNTSLIGALGIFSLAILLFQYKNKFVDSIGLILIVASLLILNMGAGIPLVGRFTTVLTPFGIILVLSNIDYNNFKIGYFISLIFFIAYALKTYWINADGYLAFNMLIEGVFH